MKLMKPGPLTDSDREVISYFQDKNDLVVDGKVGHQTWSYTINTINFLNDGIGELQCLVEDAEARANDLANENARLMLGLEDKRAANCFGCCFVGVVIGLVVMGAAIAFF